MFKFRPPVEKRLDFARFGKKIPDIPHDWRQRNVLVTAEIELLTGHTLFPLGDPALLVSLEMELADLLMRKQIPHLTVAKILEDDRELTQAVARALFNRGAAGAEFLSKHDGKSSVALFEGRARLVQRGEPKPLTDPIPEFLQVCRELELDVEPAPEG